MHRTSAFIAFVGQAPVQHVKSHASLYKFVFARYTYLVAIALVGSFGQ